MVSLPLLLLFLGCVRIPSSVAQLSAPRAWRVACPRDAKLFGSVHATAEPRATRSPFCSGARPVESDTSILDIFGRDLLSGVVCVFFALIFNSQFRRRDKRSESVGLMPGLWKSLLDFKEIEIQRMKITTLISIWHIISILVRFLILFSNRQDEDFKNLIRQANIQIKKKERKGHQHTLDVPQPATSP